MPRRILTLFFAIVLGTSTLSAQSPEGSLRLIFAGDIMGHMPQLDAARQQGGKYDFTPCFRFVKDYIQSADIAVANLEVTLAGQPYTSYPCFSSPDALAIAAKEAGFDILSTANNHCMDKGKKGLERTLMMLDSLQIPHLGTYADLDSRMENHPLIVERNGIRLALLCYTYGTNGISVQSPNVVNYIDSTLMLRDIRKAQLSKADYIIAMIHWGIEYQTHSNAEQEGLARWLLDEGVDAIIAGHPHVVQNLTLDANLENQRYPELVVYSMGNLVSNQRSLHTDGGIMIELELQKELTSTRISSCAYMPYWVNRGTYDGLRQYYILPAADALAHPGTYQLDGEAQQALRTFYENTTERLQPKAQGTSEEAIFERHFYTNGRPALPLRYTYYQFDYEADHIDTSLCWVTAFAGQYNITSQQPQGRHIPGYAEQIQYVDLWGDKSYTALHFDDGENKYYETAPYQANAPRWDTLPSNGPDTRYVTTINSNKIDITVRNNDVEINPLPHYRRLPGLVTEMKRNGQRYLQLASVDTLSYYRCAIPREIGEKVTPKALSDAKKQKMILTTRIFDKQQIHWGAKNLSWSEQGPVPIPEADSIWEGAIPCDTTIHFAGGTLILKRLELPQLPDHYQLFLELHQQSNGDAYDRTGSIFMIPRGLEKTFFDGINRSPDSLPQYIARDGSRYQGIVANSHYLPPVELMRFFTPFGVHHYNDRVQIEGLEWADEAYYKQEVTDMAYYLQGDVWIGAFIGNYDGGGHLVTLDLKAYPQEELWTEERYQLWSQPLFNTCNVLEMAGQNYGRLFGTDTLTVDFYVPENVSDLRLRFLSTGHGGWGGGDEFNPKVNTLFVDGVPTFRHTPWRCDCGTYRSLNPVSGNFWNGVSSSDYSRSGWCPGTVTPPVYFDLSWLTPGWHTLSLAIPQGESLEGSFSHWMTSALLLGNLSLSVNTKK